jgi:hypothetical protein
LAILPATRLYLSAKPTLAVAWVTTGKNFSLSGCRVFLGKKLHHRVVAAAQDVFGIGHRHALDSTHQQVFAHGNRRLGGTVHAGHQLVNRLALAGHFEQLGHVFQETRQLNAHLRIAEKAVSLSKHADRCERAFFQPDLQPLAGIFVGEVGQRQRARLLVINQHQQCHSAEK